MTRRVRWTLLATAGAVLWLAIYRLRPAPLEVQVAVAARGPLRQTIHAEGQTRVRDRFLVTAPVAGRLERPRVRPGDAVLSGALLGWLVPAPLDERSRRQAEAQVAALEDASLGAEALEKVISIVCEAFLARVKVDGVTVTLIPLRPVTETL